MSANAGENPEPRLILPPHAPQVRLSTQCNGRPTYCRATTPVVLVGARRDCGLSLAQPGVSKIHCAIVNTGRAILVRDLLSRSGTFLNKQPIRTAVLRPGDALQVGPAQVRVKFSGGRRRPAVEQSDSLRLRTPFSLAVGQGRWEVVENASVIGRRHGSDLVIDSPDVSLTHALVFVLDGRPVVCDLGSRSGTFVNGERVDLSWLNDGDRLEIGGEQMTVHSQASAEVTMSTEFSTATPNAEPAAENGASSAKRDSQPSAPAAGSSSPLGALEQTLAALNSQFLAARARIEESEVQLEQREAAAARQSDELESRRNAVAQAEAELECRAAEAQQRLATEEARARDARAKLEQQEQALNETREARHREEETLQQRAAELQAAAAEVAQSREALEREQAELTRQQAEHAGALGALAERQRHVAEQEATLESRTRELDGRETSLAAREARDAELVEKIAQFKAVLGQAGEAFVTTTSPAASKTSEPPASSGKGQAEPVDSAEDQPAPEASEPGQSGIAEDALPAPVVDQPLFTAGRTAPPADWPPELRERFHVLRRVSDRSDEELLTRVWADREKVLEQSASSDQRAAKRKRRFWGN